MPDHCFCEAIRPGTVAQPANTWSNLGFVLVGCFIIGLTYRDRKRGAPAHVSPSVAWTYGVALVFIGYGSLFYHASLTFVGQFFDVLGMYLLAVFILLYALGKRSGRQLGPRFVVAYALINVVLAYALWTVPFLRRWLFAALIIGALALEMAPQAALPGMASVRDRRYLFASIGLLALAFGIWVLDITHAVCVPTSLWQGHAFWHLLDAAAATTLWFYYRSETPSWQPVEHLLVSSATPSDSPSR